MTRKHWLVIGAAWIGWVFDSMDTTLFAMIMPATLQDLLGVTAGKPEIATHAGIIYAIFLVGWALGGTIFGVIADYLGRSRTLSISILIYAIFTGVAALSQTWQELALWRFITAIGIGGEWAAGSALVSESFPDSSRIRVLSVMQSAWGVGFFVAALVNLFVAPWALNHNLTPWRAVLIVGILPALFAAVIREKVEEPEKWLKVKQLRKNINLSLKRTGDSGAKDRKRFDAYKVLTIRQIFWPEMRRDTLVGSVLAFTAVFGLWAVTNWTPAFVEELLSGKNFTERIISDYKSYAIMLLNGGAVLGYMLFGPLANRMGRKKTFGLFFSGSLLLAPSIFYFVKDYRILLALLPILGFFNNGVFSGFPIYLAELYPTRIRATGQGFCFNFGRLLAATGPLLTGYLVTTFGSYAQAVALVSLIYLVGIITLFWARETNGKPLPD